MKVVVCARSLNEERNIERFSRAYGAFADEIVLVDGGSTDGTVTLARRLPKMVVSTFGERVYSGKSWRNPHGLHINACIQGAIDRGADWIIFDDVDCVPTVALQQEARTILETTHQHSVFLYRMYIYKDDSWFPRMNWPGKSLWAWRADFPIRASVGDPRQHMMNFPRGMSVRELGYPLSCMHYFAESEETIAKKIDFYAKNEELVMEHPLATPAFGPLELLPLWARWEE